MSNNTSPFARRYTYAEAIANANYYHDISRMTSTPASAEQMSRLEERLSLARDSRNHGTLDASQLSTISKGQSTAEIHGYDDGLGCALHSDHPPFFTPSYLTKSRHVQRLREERDAHIAELREKRRLQQPASRKVPLSTSSSASNLNGRGHASSQSLNTMHRGVAQHIVERLPHHHEQRRGLSPLPSRWSDDDKAAGLETLRDGVEVRLSGHIKNSDEAAAIRADHPAPREVGIYYFEVQILSKAKDGLVGIGFNGRKTALTRLPGWEPESYAYHGDDGFIFSGSANGKVYGPQYTYQDVVGAGINFRTNTVFFTRNGNLLGDAFTDVKTDALWPAVGLKRSSEHIRANFGQQPFAYDIDAVVDQERQVAFTSLNLEKVTKLHPPDDERILIQNLIAQYLAHEGYVGTSKAFAGDIAERQRAAPTPSPSALSAYHESDDVHAGQRQQIRRAILDGDIDLALRHTQQQYPTVLADERNKGIEFKLKCRKFIEMVRRYSDLQPADTPSNDSSSLDLPASNGHSQNDTQMEIDDQLQREASKVAGVPVSTQDDVDMDTANDLPSKTSMMKQGELQIALITYGQELEAEFGHDAPENIRKDLDAIFSLLAYPDPKASPVGHLLDMHGRGSIAEELNGAILVSLGKPSSAALEKLCMQTEAFLDAAASKSGGLAAFVNIREDILKA